MTAILGSDQRYQRLLVECARRFGRWQNLLGSRRSHDARAPSLKAELEFQRAQQALERRRMQLSDLARGEG